MGATGLVLGTVEDVAGGGEGVERVAGGEGVDGAVGGEGVEGAAGELRRWGVLASSMTTALFWGRTLSLEKAPGVATRFTRRWPGSRSIRAVTPAEVVARTRDLMSPCHSSSDAAPSLICWSLIAMSPRPSLPRLSAIVTVTFVAFGVTLTFFTRSGGAGGLCSTGIGVVRNRSPC